MASSNALTNRLDELRSRTHQVTSSEAPSGYTTPSRHSGSFMPSHSSSTNESRASLQRRFTTDLSKMPTLPPIGQLPNQGIEPTEYSSVSLICLSRVVFGFRLGLVWRFLVLIIRLLTSVNPGSPQSPTRKHSFPCLTSSILNCLPSPTIHPHSSLNSHLRYRPCHFVISFRSLTLSSGRRSALNTTGFESSGVASKPSWRSSTSNKLVKSNSWIR